jgi:hypothetical protein
MPQRHSQSVAILSIQKLAIDLQELTDGYPLGEVRPKSPIRAKQAAAAEEMMECAEEIRKHAAISRDIAQG